jgi:hypothetical protein
MTVSTGQLLAEEAVTRDHGPGSDAASALVVTLPCVDAPF